MGPVRMLLPLLRATARMSPRAGGPLLGVALLRCAAPDWVLVRPAPPVRRSAWAEEAVALYRPLADRTRPEQRHRDALSRALAVHAETLVLSGRYTEVGAAVDAALGVPGARRSPALTAYAVHARAQALVHGGRAEEALAPAQECVALYRGMAPPGRRDRRLGGLPSALRTQAFALASLGRTEESVAVYLECAALLWDMSLRRSSRFLRLRPEVLVESVGGLRELGRYEEALALEPEARDAMHEVIAKLHPEFLLPLRVRFLTDLAFCRSATGSPTAARTSAEEAVAEARRLAEHPHWLAEALRCLALVLTEPEPHGEELSALTELTDLYTRLAADRPEAFGQLLADALDDLAHSHTRSGDHRTAVADTERAVTASRRSPHHEDQLAHLLSNLSTRQQDAEGAEGAENAESAVANSREAVALTRPLVESDSETYRPLIARRLRVLARALGRTGDHTAAVACYEEAESFLRGPSGRPGTDADLALTVSNLSIALRRAALDRLAAGRPEEAVAALRSLLALTHRSDAPEVHARCVIAFAKARAKRPDDIDIDIVRVWERVVGEPYPTFVYRRTGTRGRGAKPAAR
ncbi:hypothetical protein R6V09_35840 [Streptomyces sp. W16]|uniref:hypothetical protein n=1 Tax=Streptomyces sp. W16 TaxID=3076631 RepID=UPI00295AAC3D|nr:hypothetical protein [Streptomyces sp. W16]MDV9175470.1 hypothetical protein [Streptomyces sp. W16]